MFVHACGRSRVFPPARSSARLIHCIQPETPTYEADVSFQRSHETGVPTCLAERRRRCLIPFLSAESPTWRPPRPTRGPSSECQRMPVSHGTSMSVTAPAVTTASMDLHDIPTSAVTT